MPRYIKTLRQSVFFYRAGARIYNFIDNIVVQSGRASFRDDAAMSYHLCIGLVVHMFRSGLILVVSARMHMRNTRSDIPTKASILRASQF